MKFIKKLFKKRTKEKPKETVRDFKKIEPLLKNPFIVTNLEDLDFNKTVEGADLISDE